MKKDDYFVISYRILAYLYDCLKKGNSPQMDVISAEAMGINEKYWHCILRSLVEKGRIRGGVYAPDIAGGGFLGVSNPMITEEGICFLQENSSMSRAKRFLIEIKAMVPGL